MSYNIVGFERKVIEKCLFKFTLFHSAQSNDQFEIIPRFNEIGIFNNVVSVHMCFNNFDGRKFVCIKL